MHLTTHHKLTSGWQEGLLAAALTAVPAAVLWAALPGSRASAAAGLAAGVVAGGLLLMATLTFYLHGLAGPRPHRDWIAVAMVLLATELTLGSGLRLIETGGSDGTRGGSPRSTCW